MTLKELLQLAGVSIPSPNADCLNRIVTKVTDRSKDVVPGSLFVAVKGFTSNGHDFIEEAATFGALAAIVEHEVPVDLPQYKVADSRRALALLCAAFFGHPAEKLAILGITGTNGKTTTTQMIYHILSPLRKCGLIGGVDIRIGKEKVPSKITTPEPPELHGLFAEMENKKVDLVSMEVSSHALEFYRVHGVPFKVAGYTNISADHHDIHHSIEHYAKTKQKLISLVVDDGYVVYNYDDSLVRQIVSGCQKRAISYGQHPEADVCFRVTGDRQYRLEFKRDLQELFPVKLNTANIALSVPGLHNIYNSALAISISLLFGCSIDHICSRLATFPGVHRRLELIFDGKYKILDDYAHNPDGLRSSVASIEQLKPSRLILVYALRGNRGTQINYENGVALREAVAELRMPVFLIATYYSDCTDAQNVVHPKELEAFSQGISGFSGTLKQEPLLGQAIADALLLAQEGDVILLLGAQGMEHARKFILQHLPVGV